MHRRAPGKALVRGMKSFDGTAAALIASQAGGAVEQYGGGKRAQRKAANSSHANKGKPKGKWKPKGKRKGSSGRLE